MPFSNSPSNARSSSGPSLVQLWISCKPLNSKEKFQMVQVVQVFINVLEK